MERPSTYFSIIIPAYNEGGSIATTLKAITEHFKAKTVDDYEILVVNDHSQDTTESILSTLSQHNTHIRYINNNLPNGFGYALRAGLNNYVGEVACIVMGDLSDAPEDIYRYYCEMKKGAECVFGSRFIKGSQLHDYPRLKYLINRLANNVVKVLFGIPHNDITNAFKCYRRNVIDGTRPHMSAHFNLTIELPLKAIVRGYTFVTVPISWRNRLAGESNLHMREMGSRYLFIMLYVLLEKWLSQGDYSRKPE